MRPYLFLTILLICSCCTSKISVSNLLKSKQELTDALNDSIFLQIKNNSELAIVAGTINSNGINGQYTIFAKQNGVWLRIDYLKNEYRTQSDPCYNYKVESVSNKTCESAFSQLAQIKFWDITDKVDWSCYNKKVPIDSLRKYSCSINDAPTSIIMTFYKNRYVSLKEYYAPVYFNNCCPYNKDRQIFVKAYQILCPQSKSW